MGIKEPWEYVANPAAKSSEEGWILLNDYLEWEETTVRSADWCQYYPTNDFNRTVRSPEADGYQLEIYAIEVIFANNRFDFWSQLEFRSINGTAGNRVTVIAPIQSPNNRSLDLNEEATHDRELYADATMQIPINHYFAEMAEPFLMPATQEYELQCQAIPAVNDLVEVRIWGKIVED